MLSPCPQLRASVARRRWPAVIAAMLLAMAGCGKDAPPPPRPAPPPPPAPVVATTDSVAPTVDTHWDASAGRAIYLPSDGGGAQVVLPQFVDDSVPSPSGAPIPAGAAPASVDLFSSAGHVGTVTLGEFAAAAQPDVGAGCDAWPVVPMREASGAAPPRWRIAFQSGVAAAVPLDSIGGMSRGDSTQLAVAINRAAALLPLDSAGVLRRVPFSVTEAYHANLDGTDVVLTIVERRLNLEASPRVERTTLLLERPAGSRNYSAAWRDTQNATEDDLIAVELLSFVFVGPGRRPTAFLGLDFGDGSRVQMLQRSPSGSWSLRWASAYTGC